MSNQLSYKNENISILSALKIQDELIDQVYFITENNDNEKLKLPDAVKERVNVCQSNKENEILVYYSDNQKNILALFFEQSQTRSEKLEAIRCFGAQLIQSLSETESVHFLNLKASFKLAERLALFEGLLLSLYKFKKYTKEAKRRLREIYIENDAINKKTIRNLLNLVSGVTIAKNLVNEPPNALNAVQFSETCRQLGLEYGFKVNVLGQKEIEANKMGGLLAVNQGSNIPPTFTIMTYKPDDAINSRPLVLVGKGVMFDTGGYSLKVGGSMSSMKSDMAGAASVLGIISALALNKLPYYVIGLVPATDNKITSSALVVDDIITMHDGTTVEVQNTDAEGRLVLADALSYAKKYKPELVIDLATLTGAAAAITGSFGIAMAGNNEALQYELMQCGDSVYERLVTLPFWKEFEALLKSEVADLKNIGGPVGGASTAGKFLSHFTDYNWIHLDIAGASFLKEKKCYRQAGGTGIGVRLIYEFISQRCLAAERK